MKYALYGLPCAGKTTILERLGIQTIHGSTELNKMSSGRFSDLPDDKKAELRIRYANQLSVRNDTFISDGHYSFFDDVVFTESDAKLYDVFIYLYCEPKIIHERLKFSLKNNRFSKFSIKNISKWQNYEIECLRKECHQRNKDFYVVKDITAKDLQAFIEEIENGLSSYRLAVNIAEQIMHTYHKPCELHICDGDKTLIEQDSFRICTNGHVTHAFDGNFYTGYQSMIFTKEIFNIQYDTEKLCSVTLNNKIFDRISHKNYIVLSSGVNILWQHLSKQFKLKNIIADTRISSDTKYYVVKLLQEKGYTIFAYGDSKNDLYMLKQADKGYLYIGNYLSRSLRDSDIAGVNLIYNNSPYILENYDNTITEDIAICKSDSGINGSPLADAHIRLGKKLGEVMCDFIPNNNTAIVVLERSGRFFGDGLYTGFGGEFYSFNPQSGDIPKTDKDIVVIVDGVINTGTSIIQTIEQLKGLNSNLEIFIATNVIQEKALKLLRDYKVFTVRASVNSFIGSRQAQQKDGKGPDTADRLYNYID